MARLWRLLVPGCDPGADIPLPPDEAHHARRVLRLAPGDRVAIFDGAGGEWEAELVAPDLARALRPIDAPVEPPRPFRLYQGLCRSDRIDQVVQKGTELGLAAIVVWTGARRADAPPPKPARLERWRRIAAEACKQSGRRVLPAVEAIDALPAPPADVAAFLLDPLAPRPLGAPAGGESGPAARVAASAAAAVWLAVGPESGLDPAEAEAAEQAGWTRAALGPRVLRAETAGIVATAVALRLWGDLG